MPGMVSCMVCIPSGVRNVWRYLIMGLLWQLLMQRGTILVQQLCDVLVPVAVSGVTAVMILENGANRSCVAISLYHEL
jgi:hypothetical protein